MLNWVDVAQIDNFQTKIGEASMKGLQNNDRGDPHYRREDDMNHKYYYSTNIYDEYKDA